MAAKKKVGKKKTNKALSTMDAFKTQLAEMAQTESERIKGSDANRLSTKGGEFSYKGSDLGEELEVVILSFTYENAWYDTAYDPDAMTTPACFSIDTALDYMVPHKDSPNPQCVDCASCEKNEWGSDDRGKGKACGNHRKIAVLAASDLDSNTPEDVEVALLRTAPTSNKNFDKFVKGVASKLKLPPLGVICQLTFDEEYDYPVVVFKAQAAIDNVSHMQLAMDKLEEAQTMLMEGYDPSGYSAESSTKSKKKSKKKAKKKRVKFSK